MISPGTRSLPGPVRDLPIFWKLLLPFLMLLLIVGAAGAFVIVRDLTEKSAAALSEQLSVRALDARSLVHDSELDLLESANYASNLDGMVAAAERGNGAGVTALLGSVRALKTDLDAVVVTDRQGRALAELTESGVDWATTASVRAAIDGGGTTKTAGFVRVGERSLMIMVAPICSGAPCTPVGYAVVGIDSVRVAERVAAAAGDVEDAPKGVSLYDSDGASLATTGETQPAPQVFDAGDIVQRRHGDLASAYTAFTLAGRPAGVVAVTITADTAFSAVRGPALRLIAVLVVAMLAAVAVGAGVSRLILRQLRAVVQTSRELGAGRLSARAPVMSSDEHGELAAVLNQMAEQLEAERASLELQVEQRTEEIRRLLRDRTEFFAGLSHELRTPLAVIATQAEMLTDRGARDAIGGSAEQLLELINDILELARAEAGSMDLHTERVALADWFSELSPMLVRLGAAADVDVQVDIARRLPAVTADPARLRQILVNLVDNAIKYTPAGGRVTVNAASESNLVRVTVTDTGVGIPDDVGDRVFEPFYRVPSTSPQSNQSSSGLGLALVRRAVEAHGGTIEWRPVSGGGTAFTFTLKSVKSGRRSRTADPNHAAAIASPV
jgi:signal transduction histidine kinase